MIRALCLVLSLGMVSSEPVLAETARVFSGEHGAFTRLVVNLPVETQWTLGRTPAGYGFAAISGAQPEYDLTSVWQRISRSRVAALEVNPETGALMISLACDCHVFPFEYRPGAVVLDVKPGPAPSGSEFEASLAGLPSVSVPLASASKGGTYNLVRDLPALAVRPSTTLRMPLSTGEASLETLRNSLLEQIARGATDGIVDIGTLIPEATTVGPAAESLPWSITVGEIPGVRVTDADAFVVGEAPIADCPAGDLLEISTWGGNGTPMDILAAARNGLYGELDIADPEALLRSVRSHLFLGFGAEAAQLAELASLGDNNEVMALYRSMALALDGDSDPGTPFADMLGCDGAAALWAALARDRLPRAPDLNRDAILRSFLALPPHLRAHLGSRLAEKFLNIDDLNAVRTIRDAMERTPHMDAATVALLDAERELHLGNPDAAQIHAEEVVSIEGNAAEGFIALVEAHFQKLAPVGPDIAEALISGRAEAGETRRTSDIDRAIVLALALSGQVDAAFENEAATGTTLVDLWRVVLNLASEDDFLRHAVLPADSPPPALASNLDLDISRRLLALGFPDAALTWMGSVRPEDSMDRRLVAGAALQALGDAPSALALLEGLPGPDAAAVRAEAMLQLGDLTAAKEALSATGKAEAAARTDLWRGDWSALDPTTQEIWKSAADLTRPTESDGTAGLLSRGAQTLAASASSRATIESLLNDVAPPDDP